MKKREIKYKGKTIIIEQVHGITIIRTDKIFRRRMGTEEEVVEKLLKEVKEIIDIDRATKK